VKTSERAQRLAVELVTARIAKLEHEDLGDLGEAANRALVDELMDAPTSVLVGVIGALVSAVTCATSAAAAFQSPDRLLPQNGMSTEWRAYLDTGPLVVR